MPIPREVELDFSHAIRQRGAEYVTRGDVSIMKTTGSAIQAAVQGTSTYRVKIKLLPDALDYTCTCPFFSDHGEPCKHIWATLLAADEQGLIPDEYLDIYRDTDSASTGYDGEDVDGEAEQPEVPEEDPPVRLPSRRAGRTDQRQNQGQRWRNPLPEWRKRLQHVREIAEYLDPRAFTAGTGEAGPFPPDRRLVYLVDVEGTIQKARGLIVELFLQRQLSDGRWDRPRASSLDLAQWLSVPDETDRLIAHLLLGAEDEWGYRSGSNRRFVIPRHAFDMTLRLMCQTGRCGLRRAAKPDGFEPLRWDAGAPLEFWVDIRPGDDADHVVLEGSLRRGETTVPLAAPVVTLSDGLVIFDDHVARLDHGGAWSVLAGLRVEKRIEVPRASLDKLLGELSGLARLPKLNVSPELEVQVYTDPPQPILTLRRSRGAGTPARRRKWGTPPAPQRPDDLQAQLTFRYGEHEVKYGEVGALIFDPASRRLVRRDAVAESAARQRLEREGARAQWSWDSIDRNLVLPANRFNTAVLALMESGWEVRADGSHFHRPGEIRVEVRSGIDWFELDGTVDYGGVAIPLPRLLAALERGQRMIELGDGSVGLLPDEWLKKYAPLAGLGEVDGETLKFSRTQVGFLDALLSTMPQARCDETFRKAREELARFGGIEPVDAPPGFGGELRPYQREGLGWLNFLQRFGFGGCLADDMGLGKTVQVLALLESRRQAKVDAPSLVVVPRSLVFNWKAEAARFTPNLRVLDHSGINRTRQAEHFAGFDMILTTYGTLRRDAGYFKDVTFDYVILDEAQAIKNANTEAAKAARLLRGNHRLALSGTPIENRLAELWSLFEFLNPGMLGSAGVFRSLITSNGNVIGGNHESGASDAATSSTAADGRQTLARALRPFILRRTKQQVASDLPEKLEQTLYCDLDKQQRDLYDELREHYRQSLLSRIDRVGLNKSKMHVLEALLRLRQAACHPGLIDRARGDEDSAKLQVLWDLLTEVSSEGHKALIFSQFTSLLAILRTRLDREKITYEYLDGKTRDRQARVHRFQNDETCKLFLVSLKAGGVGLNLTAADYVFLLDPWWNPAVEAQAIDRTHRIGQTRRVFAYRLIARDTVEEKVLQLQQSKRDLADAIITADNSVIAKLTREDLQLLLS